MDAKRRAEIEEFAGEWTALSPGYRADARYPNAIRELLDALDEADVEVEAAKEEIERLKFVQSSFTDERAQLLKDIEKLKIRETNLFHMLEHTGSGELEAARKIGIQQEEIERLRIPAEKWLKLERDLMNMKIEIRDDPQQRIIETLQNEVSTLRAHIERLRAERTRGQWTGD